MPGEGDATDQDFALAVTNGTTGAVNPQPSVSALSSTSAQVGAEGFTLMVSGADFLPGAIVRWRNGGDVTDLVPTSSTTTTLVVSVPPQLLAAPGEAQVTAVNPLPGGGPAAQQLLFAIIGSYEVYLPLIQPSSNV
ncbi:MAG: hypothetical protein H7Y32_01165 [Chloroflexales bacterium]|nr:hypothetical protein [Chloroflexales bacterium]